MAGSRISSGSSSRAAATFSVVVSMRAIYLPSKLPRSLFLLARRKQPKLTRFAARLGEAEVAEGVRREQAAAGSALHEPALDQERLDDVLDGIARLGKSRRDGLDPDRTAAVIHRDHLEIAPVHGVEADGVDFQLQQCA